MKKITLIGALVLMVCSGLFARGGTEHNSAFRYVVDQTPEIVMAAVQEDGLNLMYVKNQTEEICLAAVRQNPQALRYVVDQTPEIVMAAVQRDN